MILDSVSATDAENFMCMVPFADKNTYFFHSPQYTHADIKYMCIISSYRSLCIYNFHPTKISSDNNNNNNKRQHNMYKCI